jgi:hypothetical protein
MNVIVIVHALAIKEESLVLISHIQKVVILNEKFMHEFNSGYDTFRMFI